MQVITIPHVHNPEVTDSEGTSEPAKRGKASGMFFFSSAKYLLQILGSQENRPPGLEMTDNKEEESNDEKGGDEKSGDEDMMCDSVGNAPPLISLKKRAAKIPGGMGNAPLLSRSATKTYGGVGNAQLLRQSAWYIFFFS